jgi:hypothetical protein
VKLAENDVFGSAVVKCVIFDRINCVKDESYCAADVNVFCGAVHAPDRMDIRNS